MGNMNLIKLKLKKKGNKMEFAGISKIKEIVQEEIYVNIFIWKNPNPRINNKIYSKQKNANNFQNAVIKIANSLMEKVNFDALNFLMEFVNNNTAQNYTLRNNNMNHRILQVLEIIHNIYKMDNKIHYYKAKTGRN